MAGIHLLGFRVEPQIEETLEKAAKEDRRFVSSFVEKILPEWLWAEGLLRTRASS